MTVRLLTDADVSAALTPERTRTWMREALRAHTFGDLTAPARTDAMIGQRRLRLTAGQEHVPRAGRGDRADHHDPAGHDGHHDHDYPAGHDGHDGHDDIVGRRSPRRGGWFGFRSYLAPGDGTSDEVTVVFDESDGRARGIHLGTTLAPRRCGAVGAIALDALADPQARTLGLVGTGLQAWHQLWALHGLRSFDDITVYSRDAGRRERFAERARTELGLPVRAVDDARRAVRDRPIVVLATHSSTPVIEASWLAPGAYLATVGPKQVGHHEFGLDLLERLGLAVTDSVSQVSSYVPPNILTTTVDPPCLLSLGDVLWRGLPEVDGIVGGGDLTGFFSVGLGGSEAYLLSRLLEEL